MISIIDYLEHSTELYPDKVAVACGDQKITFAELRNRARGLAAAIPANNKNKPICVFANRSADVAVMYLAVIYSGNYYVPIDPDMPVAKMQSILDDSQSTVILGDNSTRALIEGLSFSGIFLTIDSATHSFRELPKYDRLAPLYMVYTSGSTGKPKGVLKSHGSMVDFIETYIQTFDFSANDVIGNQTPFFFDASAKDFYLSLKLGATLEIIPTEKFAMPLELIDYMNERRISFISWVPTALVIISKLKAFSFAKPEYLTKVFFVGEVMPMKHLNYWRSNLPEVQYVNLYGQSEIAGVCCYYEVNEDFDDAQTLPMGRPLDNCRIYLMKNKKVINTPGEIGELFIASKALALEYFNDYEKTQATFLIKDFGNGPERCFKTGDLAEYDSKGNLLFTSRFDFQIKHMGRRIELGEIEVVAGALSEIQRCCAVYDGEKSRIILFAELSEHSNDLSGKDIRKILKDKLSSYMLPSKVIILDRLPLNANGKIDRQKLMEII